MVATDGCVEQTLQTGQPRSREGGGIGMTPGDGEWIAMRGYRWQYDHIATRV